MTDKQQSKDQQEIKRVTDIWTDDMSVLFTSTWGWTPEKWGTIGWTGQRGKSHRENLLAELSDPYITVCYVTKKETNPNLRGKIAGFYLLSHETGDRDTFTDPQHHSQEPEKWRYSIRALRAFSYLPELRPIAMEVFPDLNNRAQHVGSMGDILTDPEITNYLRSIPYKEVEVYQPVAALAASEEEPQRGFVRAGPAAREGYVVTQGSQSLKSDLYILRLKGDVAAYLGRQEETRSIIKIGLSASPEQRRQDFQKAMPKGSFQWEVNRTRRLLDLPLCDNYDAAVRGEYAMKRHLAAAKRAEWLGGEFYLADENDIEKAWQMGCDAVERAR